MSMRRWDSLRGYDAVHLASAIQLSERFDVVRSLAFDDRLNEAARSVELTVYGETEKLAG